MKRIFKVMASMLMVAAFAAATVSCSKEDEEDGLIGRWVFQEANMNFLYEGQWHNSKEEGMDMSSYLSDFRGMYWIFETDGTVVIGLNGQSGSARYSISGDKITITDGGGFSLSMEYRVSGKTLDWVWTHATFQSLGIDDSELYEWGLDDYEMILTFAKN
jgi:hypothetical protein